MKFSQACILVVLLDGCNAFSPSGLGRFPRSTARSLAVDPSSLHDGVQSLANAFSSLSISDAVDAVSSVDAPGALDAFSSVDPAPVVEAAGEVAQSDSGWFGFLTAPIEGLLQLIHTLLVTLGVDSDAWGVSIIAMTLIIKIATFPLTKTQLESTNKMQAIQPQVKEIQAKYQSNPEVMNQKIAEFYQTNDVNPLAGCLPSLVQIPIFIGLYRGVLDLAKENKLDEPFLWLPNLEGPVYGADPTSANAWLFGEWVDGAPPLGWEDTIAFLALPLFLVVSQFVSMELMTPKNQEQQGNFILKLLPLMIGWFSLNVPAALCLYWVTNNIVTTATSLAIRNGMSDPVPVGGGGAAVAAPPSQDIFAPPPMRERPAGFASAAEDVTPITAIDAEIVDEGAAEEEGFGMPEAPQRKSKKKKKKRRKN